MACGPTEKHCIKPLPGSADSSLRLPIVRAGPQELRDHLKKYAGQRFSEALADFHLLLHLAAQPNFDLATDISQLAAAVKDRSDVGEGYKMIVESIAGI